MRKETEQIKEWAGNFGKEYTDRNPHTFEEIESLYVDNYGISRSALNNDYLGDLDRNIKILEVGSNVGAQLQGLQAMGFNNLYGIELQHYAVEQSKTLTKNVNLIQGSAFDVPFKDGYFDLVFTSGVLIHIHPEDAPDAMREICRCTKRYIWGFEYYSNDWEEVVYRGHDKLLWKNDFAKSYMDICNDLKLIKEKRIRYWDNKNIDSMFLLSK